MTDPTVVLVVDDDRDARDSLVRILGRYDYAVVEAGTPDQAMELARAEPRPDAVVCDVVLPGMNGVALARKLRERGVAAPVVFISGLTHREVLDEATLDGPVAFLEKPFSPTELAEVLDGLLSEGRDPP